MIRRDDWPERLNAVIEAARHRPYVLGQHDCFRLACDAVQAMTGEDLYARFAGSYRTKREALREIRKFGAAGSAEAVDRLLGPERRKPALCAQRGDWLLFNDGANDHLGICVGSHAAVLLETGLGFVPIRSCICAWTI